jgi:hypothetical protein
MLSQLSVNPLQAFAEPAFTQPLAALNRQATGGFQEMDPAAINAGMRPQVPETPQMLPPVNIPSNVSPIDPTAGLAATDPNLQGVTPFSTASVAPQVSALTPFAEMDPATINAAMAPRTSALNPFAQQASLLGDSDKGPGGWGQTDASGIYGTPTVVGGAPVAAKTGGATGEWPSAASAGWPRTTAAQINAAMRQSDASGIDLPSAIDLGLHMIPTDPTSEKPTGTDYDVGAGLDRHLDDPSRIGDIALDIANTVRDGDTWGPNDIKDLGLSDHDQRVVNSLIGHVDLGDMGEPGYNTSPTTSVTDLPGMGFAPGVTIEEQSTFQPGVVPTHTLGSKWKDELVDAITVPTKTTLSWVDTPTPTITKRTKAVTRQENNRIRQEAKKAADQQRKDDLAAQKRAEDAQRKLDSARVAAVRAVAASAAQKDRARKEANAVLSRVGNDRNAPSQRDVNAAREVLNEIDTFASGGQEHGGFDPQGGQTGSSGMGMWT